MTAAQKAEQSCVDFAGENSGATRDAYREHTEARAEQAYTWRGREPFLSVRGKS